MVGNGSPPTVYGSCSVTAGAPKGQRTATRRKARGSRPSCRTTRSRSVATARGILPTPPLRDVLDEEQVLAGMDEAEESLLCRQRRRRSGLAELPLECRLLTLELHDLGKPRGT